ncbi:hypothetical protein NBD14_22300, partial [Salmonella sp. NW1010]|nr:hypothetical protein [Salmonella enterica]MCQ7239708.1 hypothetical protein [Salmonella enterica]MCQ7298835.1 hypothetical protein [Salmonella enterica]MCQ7321413.1 hypothetical protein [Salmonella enterica]MCQ7339177.1 hypothetical protein [Salmonella enterica]
MTLITIAVIRKFSVIYLHVRSEVGYQYGKNNMIRIIKDIFHPSPRDTLKRAKFVIYTLSSWIILFTIMPKNQYLNLIFIIANTGNDSNLLIVFYVQIMPDDFVMQLHR